MVPFWSSIRFKLAGALSLSLVLVVALGAFNVLKLGEVRQMTERVRDVSLPKVQALSTIKQSLTSHRLLASKYLEVNDFRELATISKMMKQVVKEVAAACSTYRGAQLSDMERAAIRRFETAFKNYRDSYAQVLRLTEQGDLWMAKQKFENATQSAFDAAAQILDILTRRVEEEMAATASDAQILFDGARQLTLIAGMVAVLVAIFSIWWVSRRVSTPLLTISSAMKCLTEGCEDTEVPDWSERQDEIGILSQAAAAYRESVARGERLAEMAETERTRLRAAITNMPLGMCLMNDAGEVAMCNDEFIDLYRLPQALRKPGVGYSAILNHIAARNLPDPQERATFVSDTLRELQSRNMVRGQWSFADRRKIKVMLQPMPGGWVTIHEDVTEGLAAQERIRFMARHDALTELPNRNVFAEKIAATLRDVREGGRAAVLTLDLDRFKAINDTLGHPTGDRLLQQVAGRLQQVAGSADVVARLGGDEFAVIHTVVDSEDEIGDLAAIIIDTLSQPYEIDRQVLRVGASIGIAMVPEHGETSEALLKHADLALYAAKGAGRGMYRFFEQSMDLQAQKRRRMEQDLRVALERDQIVPYYQPVVATETGRVCGFEALARWEHPGRGVIMPDEFVPIAEEVGLIGKLGRAIMRRAFTDAATWPRDIRLAINLSPQQFLTGSLIATLQQALDGTGFDAHRLDLEVTESVLLDDGPQTLKTMHALRDLGAAVAIDDFGIGYSSLSYVQRFPFDKIKIDRGFIADLDKVNALAIVRSVAALCASLGIRTTAEGVETEAQLAAIRSEGLTEAQGFLFGRAVPSDQVQRMIDAIDARSESAA